MTSEKHDIVWLLDDLPRNLVYNSCNNFYDNSQVNEDVQCEECTKMKKNHFESKLNVNSQSDMGCSHCHQLRICTMKKKHQKSSRNIFNKESDFFPAFCDIYQKILESLNSTRFLSPVGAIKSFTKS